MYRFDPTAKASPALVVAEDNFKAGPDDWLQLYTPSSAGNGTKWGTVTHVERGGRRLMLRTPNITNTEVMGVKRVANIFGDGRYLLELIVNFELPAPYGAAGSSERPRWFTFGLDTALADGTRRYYKVRYLVYDEAGPAVVHKWQWADIGGSGVFTDIAGGGINLLDRNNENKALPTYLALEVDTANGKYNGFRINSELRLGTLAASPDTTVSALGTVASSALTTFNGGLNTCIDIVNRTAGFTAGALGIQFHRLTYLGA